MSVGVFQGADHESPEGVLSIVVSWRSAEGRSKWGNISSLPMHNFFPRLLASRPPFSALRLECNIVRSVPGYASKRVVLARRRHPQASQSSNGSPR